MFYFNSHNCNLLVVPLSICKKSIWGLYCLYFYPLSSVNIGIHIKDFKFTFRCIYSVVGKFSDSVAFPCFMLSPCWKKKRKKKSIGFKSGFWRGSLKDIHRVCIFLAVCLGLYFCFSSSWLCWIRRMMQEPCKTCKIEKHEQLSTVYPA